MYGWFDVVFGDLGVGVVGLLGGHDADGGQVGRWSIGARFGRSGEYLCRCLPRLLYAHSTRRATVSCQMGNCIR